MYYSEVDGAEPTVLAWPEFSACPRHRGRLPLRTVVTTRIGDSLTMYYSEVDDVNSLLVNIGSEELTKSWSATVNISVTVTGLEAPNAEAAEEIIKDSIDVNFTSDGDIWVDDISVESVHPES